MGGRLETKKLARTWNPDLAGRLAILLLILPVVGASTQRKLELT